MDLISHHLTSLVNSSVTRGVRLAPTALPLTDCMYADDLLIFESATPQVANVVINAFHAFSAVSGQQVGPQKSYLWFSHPTSQQEREAVAQILSVPLDRDCTT